MFPSTLLSSSQGLDITPTHACVFAAHEPRAAPRRVAGPAGPRGPSVTRKTVFTFPNSFVDLDVLSTSAISHVV